MYLSVQDYPTAKSLSVFILITSILPGPVSTGWSAATLINQTKHSQASAKDGSYASYTFLH